SYYGSRSASRTVFGLVVPCRRKSWTAIDGSCLSLPAASLLSCVGHPTTLGRFYPASISCVRRYRGNAIRRCPGSSPAVRVCYDYLAGRKSSGFCNRSMLSKRSASILPTLRPIIGTTFTTDCRSTKHLDHTPDPATRPGSIGGESRRERSVCDHFLDMRGERSSPL